MRVDDLPLPPIVLDAVPTIAHWPVRPVIAIEGGVAPAVWDDPLAIWDDPTGDLVWDGDPNATGWTDATCTFTGMEIDTGEPDESGLFPATRCLVQLDNSDGRWSSYTADGTASLFGPGRTLAVWAHNAEGDWWLFCGKVARWDQRADETLEIEAFDNFSDLAQDIGTYTPGINGQKPAVRLAAILATAGEDAMPYDFAPGLVALTAQETDQAPLEEMQTVVLSDGGVLFVDADGKLLYFDRTWRAGRLDQDAIPDISDNVCTAAFIVWEPVISTNDEGLADRVILENVAELRALAGASKGYTLALTGQQWTLQEEGDALAALMLIDNSPRRLQVTEFDVYLLDPHQPEAWRAVDWRQLDKVRFVHDFAVPRGTTRVDVFVLLTSIMHAITPEGWVMSCGTSKTVSYPTPIRYDTAQEYDTGKVYGF